MFSYSSGVSYFGVPKNFVELISGIALTTLANIEIIYIPGWFFSSYLLVLYHVLKTCYKARQCVHFTTTRIITNYDNVLLQFAIGT